MIFSILDLSTTNQHLTAHKCCIVGDGFALGIGDSIFSGHEAGITMTLSALLSRSSSIRSKKWKVLNCGKFYFGHSTKDWLPPAPFPALSCEKEGSSFQKKSSSPPVLVGEGKNYYNQVFGEGSVGHDADIVIIMAGSSDILFQKNEMPAEAMKRSLIPAYSKKCTANLNEKGGKSNKVGDGPFPSNEMCSAVVNIGRLAFDLAYIQGKMVCIVGIPPPTCSEHTWYVPSSSPMPGNYSVGMTRRMNVQLLQIINEINRGCTDSIYPNKTLEHLKKSSRKDIGGPHRIKYIPLGRKHKWMKPDCKAYDGIHFNSRGYRYLCHEIFEKEDVKNLFVAAEWASWKNTLS
jgi:hypothetical protein